MLNDKLYVKISLKKSFDQSESTRAVNCVPDGNPQSYTYYKWRHRSKYGVLIRELDGGQNGVLTLQSISVEDRENTQNVVVNMCSRNCYLHW
jgi:hypothetical protein